MDTVRIHDMLECMTKWCLSELDKGKETVDTKEMSEAIDMVKDLAEAEKAVWEKCYYKKIVEAMEEEDKRQDGQERMGYDRWRYSSGEFAPTGRGHETSMAMANGKAGFTGPIYPPYLPTVYEPPYMDRMGYPGQNGPTVGRNNMGSNGGSSQSSSAGSSGRSGYTDGQNDMRRSTIDNYRDSRRYYHEEMTPQSKEQRDMDAEIYVGEALGTMREIFEEADPQMQLKIKEDFKRLAREFGI